MTPTCVRLHGLVLESEVAIPMAPPAEPNAEVDVRLRVDGAPADQSQPTQGRHLLRLDIAGVGHYEATEHSDGSSTLRFHRVCDFLVDADHTNVTVLLVPGSDPRLVDVLIQGAVVAYLLLRRGDVVLHASAITVPTGCLAVVGRSGMGKSTLAFGLAAAGHALVTDDLLRVDIGPQGVVAYQGLPELRMRRAPAVPQPFELGRRTTADGRTAVLVRAAGEGPHSVRSLVVPRLHPDAPSVTLHRLSGAEAVATLLRFPRLPGLLDRRLLADQLRQCARIAANVPVYVADVPRAPFGGIEAGKALASALAEVGLAPAARGPS